MPKKFLLLLIFVSLVFASFSNTPKAYALTCNVTLSPTVVANGSTTNVNYQVTNNGPEAITAVRIESGDTAVFEMRGGSASGWSVSYDSSQVNYSGGSMPSGQTVAFTFSVAALQESGPVSMDIFVSQDGNEFIGCDGAGNLETGEVAATATPTITPTPVPGSTSTPTPKPGSTSATATATPTPKPSDKTPPTVVVSTDFSKPLGESPTIIGTASDTGTVNPGVAKVEYSTDDGKNWIPADELESVKGKGGSVKFEFTPVLFEDGNYLIKVRATDNSGNKGVSKSYTLVIDRLPPQVGGTFISFGPQALNPNKNGVIHLLRGMDQKITLSAVGGPISISLSSGSEKFELSKNSDNGLWSGILNFSEPGTYPLTANSLDGAKNTTERIVNSVEVLSPGRIIYNKKEIKDAVVSVYYLEPIGKKFVLWDGAPYGQTNPQKSKADGSYTFFLPAGKFYIQVMASRYRTLKSDIFTLDKSTPLSSDIKLEKAKTIKLLFFVLPFPDFTVSSATITFPRDVLQEGTSPNKLVGDQMPEKELFEDTKTIKTGELRGKPYILTLLNSWLPSSSEQIKILEGLSDSEDFKTAVVIPQESDSKVALYKKRGGYIIPIYADPDGTLVAPLNLQSLPTHVFLDRRGIITNIKSGILSKDELLTNL